MVDKKEIGRRVKELRLSRDLKQLELAEMLNLSRATISNVESGNRGLSLESLKKICEVFHVDISYFDIDVKSYDEAVDLTSRLKLIFENPNVEEETKEDLYKDIMNIAYMYLNKK